jgi:phosphate transport system permease protein
LANIISTQSDGQQVELTRRVHRRNRSSRPGVYWSDRIARAIITVGGIGTIIVVLLVVLVLLANVIPLFGKSDLAFGSSVRFSSGEPISGVSDENQALAFGTDEYSELVWIVRPDQSLDVYSMADGSHLERIVAPEQVDSGKAVRASVAKLDDQHRSVLLGLEDGSVRAILWTVDVGYSSISDLDQELASALASRSAEPVVRDQTVYRVTSPGLVRKVKFADAQYLEPIPVHTASIERIDWVWTSDGSLFASAQKGTWATSSSGQIAMGRIERQLGGLAGKPKQNVEIWRADWSGLGKDSSAEHSPVGLMIGGLEDSLQSVDPSGKVIRWGPGANGILTPIDRYTTHTAQLSALSASEPLLGRSTWMLGSKGGEIEAVSLTTSDSGRELRTIHQILCSNAAIQAIASSPTHRLVAVADKVGGLKIVHVTSERLIAQLDPIELGDSYRMHFTRSGRELLVCSNEGFKRFLVDCDYPEASFASFFKPQWYEGYPEPSYVWQSTTGSSQGEPKLSLVPLIFGTLKATFYSMLIAAPIAILAAIFGSEFLSNSWRSRFKPLIELMASVPSVVLGFIGAMVLAPIMRDSLFVVLLSVGMTLFFFMLAAHLWILIPTERSIPWRKFRLPLIFLIPPLAILAAVCGSGALEHWLFGSTMQSWLSDPQQSSWPGWFLLMIPPSVVGVVWLFSGPMAGTLDWISERTGLRGQAVWQMVLFFLTSLTVLFLAFLTASVCTGLDWDTRRGLLGAYQERNALLVGGILGFAIIPLVYTLADDALQSVPQHLRSASLGCGATVWQTTIRVVVPTAMSGLFSALMIGFGRAIGETMVVLMAAGNTPLMDWNPFNGYRTLSATLATELPEAARGSAHYHTLFLAALLLFIFTLVANTCAEWVRMRFRKRAYQL